jgi:hypothetical protein
MFWLYMITFQVYRGKDNDRIHQFVLDTLYCHLSMLLDLQPMEVFFDNYFTSKKLLKHLVSIGICATGTVQKN